MAIVAGIDFGTLSVRVSIVDSALGCLGSGSAGYEVIRTADPDHATQRPADHLRALTAAMPAALAAAGVAGEAIEALAVATTGSTVLPVDENLQPLDDFYLWCDHRAKAEAAEITAAAANANLEVLRWYGGVYSSEMAWAKTLHWLRHNPAKRERLTAFVEHCDYVVALLTGVSRSADVRRSACAAGHKWLWRESAGGFPADDFWRTVDPLLVGLRDRLGVKPTRSDTLAGRLSPAWAQRLGLQAGIPIPVGALDAHWDAIGAGIAPGDLVNVIGTSTCLMAVTPMTDAIPGVFGIVDGSIHPRLLGIEAGLSAAGDIFDAIARRASRPVGELARGLENHRAGQTGLLRLVWDNGDRNVLSDPTLSGVTLGWRLGHTAQDELFAALEGTALHSRIIVERLAAHGVAINRVINAGGIPRRSDAVNQVYANVLNKPVLVPEDAVAGFGSAIFALLAAGKFSSVEEAQRRLCPGYRTFLPDEAAVAVYERLHALYQKTYFAGGSTEGRLDLRTTLRELAAIARGD